LSSQAVEGYDAPKPIFSDIDQLLVGHCEVNDNAEDDAPIPVDALSAFKETLDIFAIDRKFVGEIAVNNEICDRVTKYKSDCK